MQGRSCIRDLADGALLKLFVKPSTADGRYLDIDLGRLRPTSIEIIHDGRVVTDPQHLRQMAGAIADEAGWNMNDYSVDAPQKETWPHLLTRGQQNATEYAGTADPPTPSLVLDNPAFVAIHAAIRDFCADGVHEHLRVGHIRSAGELEDLWQIDNAAYG